MIRRPWVYKSRIKKLEERVDALERRPITKPVKIEVTCKSNSIGENIKARRQAMGMSQNNLASAVGVSVPMIFFLYILMAAIG